MTHAINSNTNLLSIDITITHNQMRESKRRGETESKKKKVGIKENKRKENLKEKEGKNNCLRLC